MHFYFTASLRITIHLEDQTDFDLKAHWKSTNVRIKQG